MIYRNTNNTRFSVVIPLYNKERFVRHSVESVLSQVYREFEVIIVDDGSTDSGVDTIRAFLSDRVRLITQKNKGPGPARNRGVNEARFEWIAFLDSDDWWLPTHLSALNRLVKGFPNAALVATRLRRFRAGRLEGSTVQDGTNDYLLNYFCGFHDDIVHSSSCAARTDALTGAGGFGAYWPGEDTVLWVRLALDHDIAVTQETTVVYRMETGGLMDVAAHQSLSERPRPVLDTIEAALLMPRYASKHADLRYYRDLLRVRYVQHALFRGEMKLARRDLALIRELQSFRLIIFRILSRLPASVMRGGLMGYRFIKWRVRRILSR